MKPPPKPFRLSQISTTWTLLAQAHGGESDKAAAARRLLLERYGPAVRGYLRAAVGTGDAADDLAQEFALALVRGNLQGASPHRGRFRQYVKGVLFHLVAKHRRSLKKQPAALNASIDVPAPPIDDACFDRTWRAGLLRRAWRALEQSHPIGFALLRRKVDEPSATAEMLANALARLQGKPASPAAARQQLHRARQRFAHYLLDAIAASLDSLADLEDEVRELNLLPYCREALGHYSA